MSKATTDPFPRRIRLDLMTPAEKAIYEATQEIEKAGASTKLTAAIQLLNLAQTLVADHVDNIEVSEPIEFFFDGI